MTLVQREVEGKDFVESLGNSEGTPPSISRTKTPSSSSLPTSLFGFTKNTPTSKKTYGSSKSLSATSPTATEPLTSDSGKTPEASTTTTSTATTTTTTTANSPGSTAVNATGSLTDKTTPTVTVEDRPDASSLSSRMDLSKPRRRSSRETPVATTSSPSREGEHVEGVLHPKTIQEEEETGGYGKHSFPTYLRPIFIPSIPSLAFHSSLLRFHPSLLALHLTPRL